MYSVRYVEPPSAARTKLADPSAMLRACFFNILLGGPHNPGPLTPLPGRHVPRRLPGRLRPQTGSRQVEDGTPSLSWK